jgi:hypothetical protein
LKKSFYCKDPSTWTPDKVGGAMYPLTQRLAQKVVGQKGAPYPLVNVTLNAYQPYPCDPNFHPFVMAPLYSGCHVTGYTVTDNMQISLEKAMTLSGAIFSPRSEKI